MIYCFSSQGWEECWGWVLLTLLWRLAAQCARSLATPPATGVGGGDSHPGGVGPHGTQARPRWGPHARGVGPHGTQAHPRWGPQREVPRVPDPPPRGGFRATHMSERTDGAIPNVTRGQPGVAQGFQRGSMSIDTRSASPEPRA